MHKPFSEAELAELWQNTEDTGKNRMIPTAEITRLPTSICSRLRAKLLRLWDKSPLPAKIRQLILGHSSQDITSRAYTNKTLEQLISAINLI